MQVAQFTDNICPECKKQTDIVKDKITSELVCTVCGAVLKLEEEISELDEINKGTKRQPNSNLASNNGIYSVIGYTDHEGRQVPREGMTLREMDNQIRKRESKARSLVKAMYIIRTTCDQMGLSETIAEEVGAMYNKYYSHGFSKGRTLKVLIAVYTYVVARNRGISRSIQDFTVCAGVRKKEFNKLYFSICRELGWVSEKKIPTIRPDEAISAARNKLKLPGNIEKKAYALFDKVRNDVTLAGKHPSSVGAAILWYVITRYGEYNIVSQEDLAKALNITTVSLRNNVRKISPLLQKVDQ